MNSLKKHLYLSSLLVLLSVSKLGYSCDLVVATPEIPPHFWIDESIPKGLTVDFFDLVAKQSDCNITYKAKPWKRVMHEMVNGGVDMTIGFYKKDREKFTRYSTSIFGRYEFYIFSFMNGEKKLTIETLYADNKKLMYLKNWFLGGLKTKIVARPKLAIPILSLDRGLKLMVAKRADAILGPKFDTLYSIKENNLSKQIKVSSEPLIGFDQYVIFSRFSIPETVYEKLNTAITQVIATGVLAKLVKAYTH